MMDVDRKAYAQGLALLLVAFLSGMVVCYSLLNRQGDGSHAYVRSDEKGGEICLVPYHWTVTGMEKLEGTKCYQKP